MDGRTLQRVVPCSNGKLPPLGFGSGVIDGFQGFTACKGSGADGQLRCEDPDDPQVFASGKGVISDPCNARAQLHRSDLFPLCVPRRLFCRIAVGQLFRLLDPECPLLQLVGLFCGRCGWFGCCRRFVWQKIDGGVQYVPDSTYYFKTDGTNYRCTISGLDPAAIYRLTISYDSSRYYLYGGLKVEGVG